MKKIKSVVRTRVRTATCPVCETEMYSRAHYDYRTCGCSNSTMVDGGFDYFRSGGVIMPKFRTRYVPYTQDELFHDWNRREDKLGIVHKGVVNAK